MRAASALGVSVTLLALCAGCRTTPPVVGAAAPGFVTEIQAFADWDSKNATPADPIVFAGSSSIRLWNTAERFPGLPIVNRGFGGSQMTDVNQYVNETLLRYSPKVVVLYAGDNDINAGRTNDQVFAEYETFVRAVHAADSTTEIVFLPIKPSLQRWALWPRMRDVNARVRVFATSNAHLHTIDLATPMLGADGKPRPELFVEDGLHMTQAGYDGWTTGLKPLLDSLAMHSRRAAAVR
ncbi:MAG: hypothetical protein H7099_19095 [Gemmatimonadaceae bacterium]|nr:hypothetical protein [Gemmatimonadaceae bacterium]